MSAWPAIALIAVSASLITACGSGPAGPTPGLSGPAQPGHAGNLAGLESSPLGAEILGAYFPATARQYAAGAKFSGKMLSLQTKITSACMARYGFNYPTVSAASASAHIWDLSQFPNIYWMKESGLMVPILHTDPPHPADPPPGKEQAYHAHLNGCTALASKPFSKLRSATQVLSSEWITIFTGIQASSQVQGRLARFSSCVQGAGAPADYSQNLNRFAVWAAGQITVPSTGAVLTGPDRHWGEVFVRCGQNLATLYEKLQIAAQAQFFRHHYQQVRNLEAEVSQMMASAEHLIKADRTSR